MKEEYWGKFAQTYDQDLDCVIGEKLLEDIHQELIHLPELGNVLELGCGTGYFTQSILAKSTRIMATDLSESLLGKAKERMGDNSRVIFQKENCMELSLSPEIFDSVFMANLIHVVEKPEQVLQESYKVLKNHGKIIIVSFTVHTMDLTEKLKLKGRFFKAWGKPPAHMRSFALDELEEMIKKSGFQIETSKIIGNKTKALFSIAKKKTTEST